MFDWVSQLLMFTTILTYSITKYVRPYSGSFQSSVTRGQLLSITLIIFWLKLFKYVRVLKTLGPFCIIIAALPKDFAKIGLVYMILYIPVVCVFFHFYRYFYINRYLCLWLHQPHYHHQVHQHHQHHQHHHQHHQLHQHHHHYQQQDQMNQFHQHH